MAKFVYLFAVLFLWSCSRDMNLYDPDYNNGTDESVDYTQSFSFRTDKSLTIEAADADGNPREGVIFRIYSASPYTDSGENKYEATPLCAAVTNTQGKLSVTFKLQNGIETLYVVPGSSSVGRMKTVAVQDVMSLQFSGAVSGENGEPLAKSVKASRERADVTSFDRTKGGVQVGQGVFDMYVPYSTDEFLPNGAQFHTQFNINTPPAGSLASKETISPAFDYLVQQWYPERENLSDMSLLEKSSDLVVNDAAGANIWVTYMGDYGFSQTEHNILGYYNYKEGEEPEFEDFVSGTGKRRITVLFSNTNSMNLVQGTKVQLLYWDGVKYSMDFPKGTRIGFVFFRNGYLFGKGGPLSTGSYAPLSKYGSQTANATNMAFFSTPTVNRTGKANGVIRRCDEYGCCVLGMDGRFFDDPSKHNDKDFNDVVVKITSNPIKALNPENDIPVDETIIPNGKVETEEDGRKVVKIGDKEVHPTNYWYGTLAFEDAWPKKGDYDFNDVVIKYEYGIELNYQSKVTGIYLKFTPLAMGATTSNGFGIEIPVLSSYLNRNIVEAGNEGYATIIVFHNGREAFPGSNGVYVNTHEGGSPVHKGTSFIYHLNLKEPLDMVQSGMRDVKVEEFNPFIFVNRRAHEIHLTNKAPTKFMDTTLFNREDDRSIPASGYYYHMDNTYPWVVDIPRKEASSGAWHYPYEQVPVTSAYKKYGTGDNLWYDWTKSGYADKSLIASPED